MVSKILKLAAVPAGLLASSYGLYAVSEREAKGDRVNPRQLSVYIVPLQELRFIEAQPGRVQCAFSAARKAVWPAVTWTRNACISIRNGVEETVQFGRDSYLYLKNPPPEFLPRVGIISVSGLAGLVLARKGSRLKKVAYPLGLGALGASICYPAQTVIFAKVTGKKLYSAGHRTYDAVSSLWKTKPQKDRAIPAPSTEAKEAVREEDGAAETSHAGPSAEEAQEPPASPEPPNRSSADPGEPSTTSVPTEQPSDVKFRPPPELVDHGQSNPEDVDLYSTRT
ncbi:MICOS complex subunit MIC27 [Bufo gargarizans]|uniref:MICOS complex subunit MIC27 n=1 Tax=Bufo gargarizans TaxID=30331 RepID=UPI001CF49F8E|nr:MICOS complex subunit MIC27 [Bufo gargarizans]